MFTVFFYGVSSFKKFHNALTTLSQRFSLVATDLSRLRLQSKNYLFTQSSSAGDFALCHLSIALTDMFKYAFQPRSFLACGIM